MSFFFSPQMKEIVSLRYIFPPYNNQSMKFDQHFSYSKLIFLLTYNSEIKISVIKKAFIMYQQQNFSIQKLEKKHVLRIIGPAN